MFLLMVLLVVFVVSVGIAMAMAIKRGGRRRLYDARMEASRWYEQFGGDSGDGDFGGGDF